MNIYQQNSRVSYTFAPNKSFGQLLDISPEKFLLFRNIWFRIFVYWSMVYWSKFWSYRERAQNKYHVSY